MERRNFVKNIATASAIGVVAHNIGPAALINPPNRPVTRVSPLAITMWDFSWLERRWPGAGDEGIYNSKLEYWKKLLTDKIKLTAVHAAKGNLPMLTTECWGIVDYKDWPLLKWDWVKELCELGTITAASTGQWIAIAISNFCGPQFVGMWRDVEWHQRLTGIIRSAAINPQLLGLKITKRL